MHISPIKNQTVLGDFMKKNILIFLITVLCLIAPLSGFADENLRFIEVQGESTVSLVPNEVHINISVERQDFNLKEAKEKASKVTKKIIDLAKTYQKDSKLIETNFIDVQPRYENQYNKQEFLGYFAQSSLNIIFTNQDTYYQFMNTLPSAAGDYSSRAHYELGNIDQINIALQQKAIENAKLKAEALAKSAGATLGNVLQIRDISIQKEGSPYPIMMMSRAKDAGSAPIQDMEAGLRDVKAYATLRFELK